MNQSHPLTWRLSYKHPVCIPPKAFAAYRRRLFLLLRLQTQLHRFKQQYKWISASYTGLLPYIEAWLPPWR